MLHGRNPDYPRSKGGEVPGYSYMAIADALTHRQVVPPEAVHPLLDTLAAFAGYLLLDAVIANQDRHHENWAVLSGGDVDRLAPSFDHASSLGFNLTDAERHDRSETNDRRRTVEAWARRAKCRPMENRPGLVDLALEALQTLRPEAVEYHRDQLQALDDSFVQGLIERISPTRMSS